MLGLADRVTFAGIVARAELDLLHRSDLVVLPAVATLILSNLAWSI
jgi:hypothetical protein